MSIWKWVLAISLIVSAPVALAQEDAASEDAAPADAAPEDAWAGKLLGDMGGLRPALAQEGISFDLDITQVLQGNAHGGANTTNALRYSGSTDIYMNFDFGKMDLIPGGSLMLHAEGKWGDGIAGKVGSLSPVNWDAIVPGFDEGCMFTLSEVIYSQVLFDGKVIFIGGKLFGGNAFDTNPFANDERTQFLNVSLRNTPMLPPFLPYTNLGFGVFLNPVEWLWVRTAVADSEGQAKTTGFETSFHGPTNTTIIHEWEFAIKPMDLEGHQRFGFAYSNMDTAKLAPKSPFKEAGPLLMAMAPTLTQKLDPFLPRDEKTQNTTFYYNFDQYVYQEEADPTQGLGLFGRFSWARESINPVHLFYSLGMGGKGLIDTRDDDTFGVGYYFLDLDDSMPAGFQSEQGVEAYYNIQVTPWMTITPDLQFIVDPGGTDDNDVAIVYGIRAQMSL